MNPMSNRFLLCPYGFRRDSPINIHNHEPIKKPCNKTLQSFLYPGRDLNPHGHHCPQDFKSCVSTDSTTRAIWLAKVQKGFCSSSLFEIHFVTFVENEAGTPSAFLLK
jgi:hypothetical protein